MLFQRLFLDFVLIINNFAICFTYSVENYIFSRQNNCPHHLTSRKCTLDHFNNRSQASTELMDFFDRIKLHYNVILISLSPMWYKHGHLQRMLHYHSSVNVLDSGHYPSAVCCGGNRIFDVSGK